MKIEDFKIFLSRHGFKENFRDKTFDKKVKDVNKRYIIKDNDIFMESKSFSQKDYILVSYADIRDVYITDDDKLSGFKRYIKVLGD